MSEVKRYRFKGAAGEYVYANDYDSTQSELAALREELAKLKQVTNFSDAVACVFDFLKTTAANTGCREWDDQLEDLAEDVIEYAPEYKKQWQDICKLQQLLADSERRNADSAALLLLAYNSGEMTGWWCDRYEAHLKPTESGASE